MREELGLSREKASELFEIISSERIERIESEKYTAHPDEVIVIAKKQALQLCDEIKSSTKWIRDYGARHLLCRAPPNTYVYNI